MSSGRLGPPSRTPSCRRRRKLASPPGPDSRSAALPITCCSIAAQAASRVPSRRRASSSTQSRTRSSSASTLTSPVTAGAPRPPPPRRPRRRAPRRRAAMPPPAPAGGGGQLHLPVGDLPPPVLIGQVPAGPHVHLREQPRQITQAQPARERGQQLLVALVPVFLGELVGPQADHPPDGLRDLPGGQRPDHPRGGGGPPGPPAVAHRAA